MSILSMLISFFVYPFYSGMKTIREFFSFRRPFLDTYMMIDYFYIVTYTMLYGKQIILLLSIIAWILGTYISKKFIAEPILNFAVGILSFIIVYWILSFFVYLIQTLAYISTNVRKVVKTLDRQKIEEDISSSDKIVH